MNNSKTTKSGTRRWARTQLQTQGQALQVMDQIEQMSKLVLTGHNHSVEAYTPAGDAIYVNDGWRRLWGMQPEVMRNYNMLRDENLHGKETWPAIKRGFEGVAGGTPEARFCPEEIGMPGRERWTDGYIAPVMDSQEQAARVVLMLRDVTDMKLAMNEIASIRNQLQELQLCYESVTERLDEIVRPCAATRLAGLPPQAELLSGAQQLSTRERQIFALLAADKPVKEIAFDLKIATKSVYTYRTRLMTKLGLRSDLQIASAYMELGTLLDE